MSATPEGGGIDGRFDELEARLSELRRSIGLSTATPAPSSPPASASPAPVPSDGPSGRATLPDAPTAEAPAEAPTVVPVVVRAPSPVRTSASVPVSAPRTPRPSEVSPAAGGVPLRDLRPPMPPRTTDATDGVPVPAPSLRSVPSVPTPSTPRPLAPVDPAPPVTAAPSTPAPSPWSVTAPGAPSARVAVPTPAGPGAREHAARDVRDGSDGGEDAASSARDGEAVPAAASTSEAAGSSPLDGAGADGADVDAGWDDVALAPAKGRRPRRWSPTADAPAVPDAPTAPDVPGTADAPAVPEVPLPPLPRSAVRPAATLPPVASPVAPVAPSAPVTPSAPSAPAAVARPARPVLPPIEWSRPPGPITVTDPDAVVAGPAVDDATGPEAVEATSPRSRRTDTRRPASAPAPAPWSADEPGDAEPLDEDAGFSARRLRALDVIAVAVVAFLLLVGIVVGIEGARDGRPTFVLDDRVAPVLRAGDVAYFVPLQAVPSVGAVVQAVVADQLVLGRILKVDGPEVRLSLDLEGGTAVVASTALVGELRTVVPMVGWPRTWWSRLPTDPLAAVGLVLTLVVIGWALIRSMRLARVAPPLDDLSDAWDLPVGPDERVR